MKAALYVRVSTDEQAKEGYSVRGQTERLENFAKSQGWTIQQTYIDDGYSAKNLDRPHMKRLMDDVETGLFDVVLVYKLDRLVRSVVDLYELLSLFDKHNVHFKSSTEMFDTTTATGRMFITLVATLAQWERELLSERTKFGMDRKFQEGNRNGGNAPFGYMLQDGELIINEDEAKWVRWLFDEIEVRGKKALASELNKKGVRTRKGAHWNTSAIDYVLTNPVYYGGLRWNYRNKKGGRTYSEVIAEGNHEPIISKEKYEEVKRTRKNRKNKGFKGHAIYPFSGVVKCNRCGHNFFGSSRKRADGSRYRFYKCTGRFVYGICDMPVIGEDALADEFINELEFVKVDAEMPQEEEVNRADIEKQLKKIENRIERIKELYFDGDISKQEYRQRLDDEKEKESELIQTLHASSQVVDAEDIKELIHSLKDNFKFFELTEQKKIIHALFDSLTIECLQAHKGGKGQKVVLDITNYSLK